MRNTLRSLFHRAHAVDGMNLHPLTLSFVGDSAGLESSFLAYYSDKKLKQSRIAILLAIFFYGLFGILDAIIFPELKSLFWEIRFGIISPFGALCFLFSLSRFFARYMQVTLSGLILVGGCGLIAMLVLAEPPLSYSYYAGLILVFMYAYTFIGLRFVWSTVVCWALLVIYQVAAYRFIEDPFVVMINNNFFYVSANLFGMLAAYFMEYYARRDFLMARLLDEEKEKVNQTNIFLEDLVRHRTSELSRTNEDLRQQIFEKEQLVREKDAMYAHLLQSEKMSSIGRLAGGVAHDFNNILSAILGYSQLAMNVLRQGPALEHLQIIHDSGRKAAALTRQLLAFSRRQVLDVKSLNLNDAVNSTAKMLVRLLGENIHFEFRPQLPLANIMADPSQIDQVLINLVVNARDAMPDGGSLLVESGDVFIGDAREAGIEVTPGLYVKLVVSDTGPGIPANIVDNIFEPFFTTKELGMGTGLGLATVYGIVKQHNGHISVKSTEGKGTTFTILLPAVSETEDGKTIAAGDILPAGTETILTVEDDDTLRQLLSCTLEPLGYRIVCAADADHALQEFMNLQGKVDLLLTDVILPGKNGRQLATDLLARQGGLRVIYMSGYTDDMLGKHGILDAGIHFLRKPFSPSDLALKVRKILDAS